MTGEAQVGREPRQVGAALARAVDGETRAVGLQELRDGSPGDELEDATEVADRNARGPRRRNAVELRLLAPDQVPDRVQHDAAMGGAVSGLGFGLARSHRQTHGVEDAGRAIAQGDDASRLVAGMLPGFTNVSLYDAEHDVAEIALDSAVGEDPNAFLAPVQELAAEAREADE